MDTDKLLLIMTIDDLNQPLSIYAKAIGINNLYRLTTVAGGQQIFIPKPENMFKELVRKLVVTEYKSGGITQEQLARKYGLEPKIIFNYIKYS